MAKRLKQHLHRLYFIPCVSHRFIMKVKFPKEQTDLFNQIGTIVNTANGSTYRYLPFWFKETDQEDVYELLTFEKLPDELIELIRDMRDSNGG